MPSGLMRISFYPAMNPITGIAGCCARRCERPRSRPAAKKGDELAPLHLITTSTKASNLCYFASTRSSSTA